MLRLFYTVFISILFPFVILYFLWRSRLVPGYRQRMLERFGIFSSKQLDALSSSKKIIWVHAVSVGEVFAAKKLISRLLEQDDLSLVVTTITPTGSDRVKEDFGEKVFHIYAPFDIPIFVNNFLNRIKPTAAIIIETELWPNILKGCDRRNIPAIVANARLSAKSARGYKRFRGIAKALFNQTTIIAAQNKTDGNRFLALGLDPEKLEITGSIKFDISVNNELKQQSIVLRKQLTPDDSRKILIAASTHTGEDETILSAFKLLLNEHPNALLILVPRHPDNFEKNYQLARHFGFKTQKRSILMNNPPLSSSCQVLIGDTMGELMLFYGTADIAFIGGSFIERGGHNMIEAAAWQVPCLSGPHVFNFAEISDRLVDCGGMKIVNDATQLYKQWHHWLCAPQAKAKAGEKAYRFVMENQGALDRLMSIIQKQINMRHT